MNRPLLEVNDLVKHYPVRSGWFGRKRQVVHAVDGVSFQIARGETLALVGESGCGKSTVGRCVLRLTPVTRGQVVLDGLRIDDMTDTTLLPQRRRLQVVFQDPFSSLNPRMRVRDILAEPIRNFGLAANAGALRTMLEGLMDRVGLPAEGLDRFPHEFSGGQRQRIGIAKALAAQPDLIVCDEAVSALDVSVKAQIVNLLQDLQQELGLALLFISHDLAIVEHMTHRVIVMYLGTIVEVATKTQLFGQALHPYTRALLSAVPNPDPEQASEKIVLHGDIPSPIDPPSGCRFHTRCPQAQALCRQTVPRLTQYAPGHLAACHFIDPAAASSTGDTA